MCRYYFLLLQTDRHQPISHQAEIQFLRGEFYDKGTLSEFTIISLWSYVCAYDLVCEHVGAELCACTNGAWVFVSVCVHVYLPLCICLQEHAQYLQYVCLLFQWWQTAEVLFPEELDNLSSEVLSQPSSTFSLQPAQTGQQSKSMCG